MKHIKLFESPEEKDEIQKFRSNHSYVEFNKNELDEISKITKSKVDTYDNGYIGIVGRKNLFLDLKISKYDDEWYVCLYVYDKLTDTSLFTYHTFLCDTFDGLKQCLSDNPK